MDGQVWKRGEQGGLGAWVVGAACPAGMQEEEQRADRAADKGCWRGIEAVLSLEVPTLKGQVRASGSRPGLVTLAYVGIE